MKIFTSTQIRSTGVTILAILEIVSGMIAIVFGAFFRVSKGFAMNETESASKITVKCVELAIDQWNE